MALFGEVDGEVDGDVGPFVMAEGEEEWFPFSLSNLEMDRACNSSPQQDESRPMDQDGDGETDQDDDVDGGNPSEEASGPGPPPAPPNPSGGNGNNWNNDGHQEQFGNSSSSEGEDWSGKQREPTQGRMKILLPEPKARLENVKPEAKEVHASHDRKRQTAEAAAQAKRSSRGDKSGSSGGSTSSKSKQKRHRPTGGMAGGIGGMTRWAEGQQAGWSASSDAKHMGGGDGERRKVSKSSPSSAATHGSGGGNGVSMTKLPTVQNKRRLERNAREQKRSLKISQRIEDLRRMLSQFGVDVKASKSAVLSEATDYIAHLQRQHAQSEAERARILQLLHNATLASSSPSAVLAAAAAGVAGVTAPDRTVKPPPSGAAPPLAHHGGGGVGVGAPAGTHPLSETLFLLDDEGDTGRPPPLQQAEEQIVPRFPGLSAAARSGADGIMPMTSSAAAAAGTTPVAMGTAASVANLAATARALSHVNYEKVFRALPMPMAIANVNGNLVDCNTRLCQVTGFRKEEALFMTIFDLVADPFLQHTFSMISSILSMRGVTGNPPFFQVPGKHFNVSPGNAVVQISVVHDEQLRPMHFCICIIDCPTAGGISAPANAAAAAGAVGVGVVNSVGARCNVLLSGGCIGGGYGGIVTSGPTGGVGSSGGGDPGTGGAGSGCVRIRANIG